MKKRPVRIGVYTICVIFALVILLKLVSSLLSVQEDVDYINVGDDIVSVVYDVREGIYFFIKEDFLLSLLNKEECVYWSKEGPGLEWGEYNESSFYIYDKAVYPTYVSIEEDGNSDLCTCMNDSDVSIKYCHSWFW